LHLFNCVEPIHLILASDEFLLLLFKFGAQSVLVIGLILDQLVELVCFFQDRLQLFLIKVFLEHAFLLIFGLLLHGVKVVNSTSGLDSFGNSCEKIASFLFLILLLFDFDFLLLRLLRFLRHLGLLGERVL